MFFSLYLFCRFCGKSEIKSEIINQMSAKNFELKYPPLAEFFFPDTKKYKTKLTPLLSKFSGKVLLRE